MKMLTFLSSMPFESDQILASLTNVRKIKIAKKTAYQGIYAEQNALIVNAGIGKVNAAVSLAETIAKFRVKTVVNIGVGGAYPGSGLKIGDVAVASKEIYGDEGVIDVKGWHSLRKIGIPLIRDGEKQFFHEYPLLIPPYAETPNDGVYGNRFRVKVGNFVSVSAVSGVLARAKELGQRFRAICENMEGAAAAQVCALYRVPMIEIRGISNMTGSRDKRRWNLNRASQNCQEFVLKMLKTIK